MLPILEAHPRGYQNPITFRANAALPAAGAWDATPLEMVVSGANRLLLTFTYDADAGAANPAFDFQIFYSIYSVVGNVPAGADEWVAMALYQPGAVAPAALTQSRVQNEYVTFAPIGLTAESFPYGPLALDKLVERIRIRARESGDVANMGDLVIVGEAV